MGDSNIAMMVDGLPYGAFSDSSQSGRATVKYYNGEGWQTVGSPGFSAGVADQIALVRGSCSPYVVYRDNNLDGKAIVMNYSYDDEAWQMLGNPVSEQAVNSISACMDEVSYSEYGIINPQPIVVYSIDTGLLYVKIYNEQTGTWESMGSVNAGSSIGIDCFSRCGAIYLAFSDSSQGGKATVMRSHYNATSATVTWEPIGAVGFTPGSVQDISLFVAPNGTPYVACTDTASGTVNLMKYAFNGMSNENMSHFEWQLVESFPTAGQPSLSIDGEQMYMAFRDQDQHMTVRKGIEPMAGVCFVYMESDGSYLQGLNDCMEYSLNGWNGTFETVPSGETEVNLTVHLDATNLPEGIIVRMQDDSGQAVWVYPNIPLRFYM